MGVDQLQLLAFAAGFGAVSEDEFDIRRISPPDETMPAARVGRDFVHGRHMPDAPAPRKALISHQPSRAVAVVQPLWLTHAKQPAQSWTHHVGAVARTMSAYLPGRSVPA